MNFRKVIAATGIVGALVFTSACSASEAASTPTSSPSASASTAPTASAEPTAATVALKMPAGIIAKGVANDGKGDYLQTSISNDDPAMKYNPAITDAAAKTHYSAAELAEAQKVIVKFIAEEAIDSTLNGGKDVEGWWSAHKNEILPGNQSIMLGDLNKSDKAVVAREDWMATKKNYSYVHGTDTPRVTARTITPKKFYYVENPALNLQGVMLDTSITYSMAVMKGTLKSIQNTNATVSFAVAKDSTDGGKWKIAGYDSNYSTREG